VQECEAKEWILAWLSGCDSDVVEATMSSKARSGDRSGRVSLMAIDRRAISAGSRCYKDALRLLDTRYPLTMAVPAEFTILNISGKFTVVCYAPQ
jgi:hypothetical protein